MLVMVLGLSYKTAPLALMERVVFPPESLPRPLDALREHVAHGVVLSTCNRVEVYGLVGHQDTGRRALLRISGRGLLRLGERARRRNRRSGGQRDKHSFGRPRCRGRVRIGHQIIPHLPPEGPGAARTGARRLSRRLKKGRSVTRGGPLAMA